MTASPLAREHPPEPDSQFDIGSTEDSLERMSELVYSNLALKDI